MAIKILAVLSILYLSVNAVPFGNHLSSDPAFNGTNWVVLCAGSNTWDNYRHQADLYHAYQVIKSHGIPDTNIIVMHYDDIAHNSENPTQGKVINRPNGPDVYKGVPKDFIGQEVNPLNFLAVLRGDPVLARNHKKVVKSGPNDHVFIYFVDHGDPNLIAFPHEYLYGEELANELITMHKNNKFAKLVFYIEACYSGSMFETLLPKDINIYVATSSGPKESSYLCWDDDERGYLSDPYTAAWLYDSEHKDLTKETLQEQYEFIRDVINKSVDAREQHSHQYGDLSIAKLPVSQFLGSKKPTQVLNLDMAKPKDNCDAIPVQDSVIYVMQKQIQMTNDIAVKTRYVNKLNEILKGRQHVDKVLIEYVDSIKHLTKLDTDLVISNIQTLYNRPCYRQFVDKFNDKCFNINQHIYAFNKLNTFVNICEQLTEANDVDMAVEHLEVFCDQHSQQANFESIQ